MTHHRSRRHRQHGVTLIESLIGFLVLCLGMVGAVQMQSWLRQHGDIARQRTEAVQFAQQDLERQRTFADTAEFRRFVSGTMEAGDARAAFTVVRTLSDGSQAWLRHSHLAVSWADRSGTPQSIQLQSSVAGLSPVYSAALSLPPQDRSLSTRRHLPAGVQRMVDGRSVLRPSRGSSVAWVVNAATGEVISQCMLPTAMADHALTTADLAECHEAPGVLLRGFIRFALRAAPDTTQANDAPPPLRLQLGDANCDTETIHAASERYLAYTCFAPPGIHPDALRIVPVGWAFGTSAHTFKACRYIAGSTRSALHNYLVIRGDIACPGTLTPHNEASAATVQHQP